MGVNSERIARGGFRSLLVVRSCLASPRRTVCLVFLLFLGVVTLLPASPLLYQTPNNDSSIFLYIGKQITEGKLPYRDAYDHKPPLIFYIDAFGLLVGGGSRWGVWGIELVSLLAAVWLAFSFIERYFGKLPAVIAISAMLVNLAFVHERGNLTEEYALPLQFAVLVLLANVETAPARARNSGGKYFAIGLALGLASALKQTMAGIGVAVGVYLFISHFGRRNYRGLIQAYGLIGLGAGFVWAACFLYFLAAGIFPEFWEAAFLMNFGVSSSSTPQRIQALLDALRWLFGQSGFFLGGMLVWLTVFPYLVLHDERLRRLITSRWMGAALAGFGLIALYKGFIRQGLTPYQFGQLSSYRMAQIAVGILLLTGGLLWFARWKYMRLGRILDAVQAIEDSDCLRNPSENFSRALPVVIALVDLPVALLASILTGRNFAHYFMPLLPSLTILLAYAVSALVGKRSTPQGAPAARSMPGSRLMSFIWLAALLLPVFIPGIQMTADQMHPRGDRQIEETARYVQQNTRPGDLVLEWGIQPAVYLLSGREAATRFFFGNTLFFDGYSGLWQTSRLLADLRAHPPVLIIDMLMARLPLITAADWKDCAPVKDAGYYQKFLDARKAPGEVVPQMPQGMGEVYYWICENYAPAAQVGELGWQVYRLKGK